MGDRGKILFGLAVFVILVTFPFWSRLAASGEVQTTLPELEYPANETACVEDTPYMTANHMNLLNQWRDDLVRRHLLERRLGAMGSRRGLGLDLRFRYGFPLRPRRAVRRPVQEHHAERDHGGVDRPGPDLRRRGSLLSPSLFRGCALGERGLCRRRRRASNHR